MDFLELVSERYSVRSYKPDPVEEEKLEQVFEAARLAPTANNLQPFQLIVIHTKGKEEELKRIYGSPWFTEAPIVIGICALPSQSWSRKDGKNYSHVDATIAMDHLILAATDLGLGTCWIGAFDPVEVRLVLGLPDDVEPIAFTPIGYPNDEPGNRHEERKSLGELVRYEHW